MNQIIGGQSNGSGNFHIDAWTTGMDRGVYLNWLTGTGGLKVGNGAEAMAPSMPLHSLYLQTDVLKIILGPLIKL
jgi:hypothetical protein